jgi:hypothetical protein
MRESMLSGRITHATIRILDWISGRISSLDNIDLIGWHKDVLDFVEVKTRTTRDVKPAEAAVPSLPKTASVPP